MDDRRIEAVAAPDDAMRDRNARALASRWGAAVRRLIDGGSAVDRPDLDATGAGAGSLSRAAAREIVRSAGADSAEKTVVFRFGSGALVEAALREAPDDARVVVAVIDPESFRRAVAAEPLSDLFRDPRLDLAFGELGEIARKLPRERGALAVVSRPSCLATVPASLAPLADMARELAGRSRSHDVQRDLVVTLDPTPASGEKLRGMPDAIPLVFFEGASPVAVGASARRFFACEKGGLLDDAHDRFGEEGKFESHGSVLPAAVELAATCGCSTIGLLGADLALTEGRRHAGSIAKGSGRSAMRRVEAKGGGTLETTESLWRHRRRLLRLVARLEGVEVLDLTARGAVLDPIERAGLESLAGRDAAERARRAMTLGLEVRKAIPPPGSAENALAPEELERRVESWRIAATVEFGTMLKLGPGWLDNLERNLPRIVSGTSVADLTGATMGRPVVVAGAGPSLEGVLPWLSEVRERVVVVAASSALGVLAEAEIVPDAAVVIESRDCSHHFDVLPDEAIRRMTLFVESVGAPAHFELPFAKVAHFHGPLGRWLAPWSGGGSIVPTGGNVGTTSLLVAWLLGGNPIGYAGLDFALADGRYYATGSGSRRDGEEAPPLEVEGWNGARVATTTELLCYRDQTEVSLSAIRARDASTRFVALSRSGAGVAGVEPPGERPSLEIGEVLSTAVHPHSPSRRDHPEDRLERLHVEIEEVRARLRELERHPEGPAIGLVSMHPSDSLVMGLVAPRIASAREWGESGADAERRALAEAVDAYDRVASRAMELACGIRS